MRHGRPKAGRMSSAIIIFSLFSLLITSFSSEVSASELSENLSKEEKLIALNAGMVVATFLWGFAYWDYGKFDPHFKSEMWFSKESYRGGADKFGHLYASYLLSTVLCSLYSSWGYEEKDAARLGALSSFILQAAMEVGDSISRYGFSYEDVIMNGLGSAFGYILNSNPEIARKIDIRLEYFPSRGFLNKGGLDFTTDYDGMKFLFALKLDGLDFIKDRHGYLKYLEVEVGYYTRGYKWKTTREKSRNVFFGLGINLSKVLESFSFGKTARVFNYYQMPYSYAPITVDLN